MKRILKPILALGLFVGLWWALASSIYPSTTVHYKTIVTVETPEGTKTGSSIREIHITRGPKILPESHSGKSEVRGEAVVVDLGSRGTLFAVMRNQKFGLNYGSSVFFHAFSLDGPLTVDGSRSFKNLKKGAVELPTELYPTFVYFKKDKGIFDSVAAVSPDEFEKIFGLGVRLQKVTIEITDEPISRADETVFPPFGSIPNMNRGDFQKGMRR